MIGESVHFGGVAAPLPDWRSADSGADPDDEELDVTPADVVSILGFDPKEFHEDGDHRRSESVKADGGGDCGANAPGGGGFQLDNTCAVGDGVSSAPYSRQRLSAALEEWMHANAMDVSNKWDRSKGYLELPGAETISAVANEQQSHTGEEPSDDALKSYDRFKTEIGEQFEAIQKSGLKVYAWDGDGEPYHASEENIWAPSSAEMRKRVEAEGKFYFFMTRKGFGSQHESVTKDHPLLKDSPYKTSDGKPMIWNDVFRVTHDMVAHVYGGFSFSTRGEFNGMLTHASTLPEEAHAALFSETFGQNAVYETTGKFSDQNVYVSKHLDLLKSRPTEKAKSMREYNDDDEPIGAGRKRQQEEYRKHKKSSAAEPVKAPKERQEKSEKPKKP